MLTASEQLIKGRYEEEGWQVFKVVWPDFIAWKEGKIKLIEAKCLGDRLSKRQRESLLLLQSIGFEIEVGYMKSTMDGKIHKKVFNKDDPFFKATKQQRRKKDWFLQKKEHLKVGEEETGIDEKEKEINEILDVLPKGGEVR